MPYPTIYNVTYSYTAFQQAQGTNLFPGTQIDADLAGLTANISSLSTFMKNVIRSDGALINGIVTYDSLSAALQTGGLVPAVAWTASTAYSVGNAVTINSNLYRCLIKHTSGVFATDLAAGNWILVAALQAGPPGTSGTNGKGQPQGRLTLTSGVAVTQTDVVGATVVYYTPGAGGDQIPLSGVLNTFTELSNISTNSAVGYAGPAAVAPNSMYDFYVWNNAGVITLTRSPAWLSDTSRGTGAGTAERQLINGFWTNKYAITNGPGAGLGTLVGTARSDGTSQFTDSLAKRWLSNVYNVVPRAMSVLETTASWTYATNTWRQARAAASNQLDFVQSVGGSTLSARVVACMANSGTTAYAITGIGLNSTTVNSAMYGATAMVTAASIYVANAFLSSTVPEGRSYAAWLEQAIGGTMTYNGTASALQCGIMGEILN